MPCRPSAPIFGQRSRGNWLLLSISAARGAISLLEKANTVSRIASAVSPRSKLNIRYALGIMVGLPPASQFRLCCAQPYSLQISLSRAEEADNWPLTAGIKPMRPNACKLSLALAPTTGCNSLKMPPCKRIVGRGTTREKAMHGTIERTEDAGQQAARERAYATPLEAFDPGHPELFRTDSFWPYFDRLRKEAPVHYAK